MSVTDEEQLQLIYKKAYEVKAKYVQPVAYYRGLIEFSNRCIKNCNYCGIRRENDKTERFDMNREDIIKMAQWAYDHEYGSITLQSGERSDDIFVDYVVDLIRDIKAIGDGSLGITMCVGEQSEEAYRRMREAGASRYLLRIETTNKELYHKIHPQDELHSFETRVECLRSFAPRRFPSRYRRHDWFAWSNRRRFSERYLVLSRHGYRHDRHGAICGTSRYAARPRGISDGHR